MTTDSTADTQAVPTAKRRRRASVGGFTLKLDAEQRPGYVRRFVNGDPARVANMEDLGYSFVNEKPGPGRKRTDGQGTRISRHAGKFETGAPMQAYLMETPIEEYQIGVAEKEERLKPFEEAIRRGDDPTGGLTRSETYEPTGRSTINHSGE